MSEEKEWFCETPAWIRLTVLPWYVWAAMAAAAVSGTAALSGCTKPDVPLCDRYQARLITGPDGQPYIVMDMANVKKLAALITGLQEGTCRIGAPETTGA